MNQKPISNLSHEERMATNLKTRIKLLNFLVGETFATQENLCIATVKDPSQVHRIVKKMSEEGLLLKSDCIEGIGRQKRSLIGITRQGILYYHIHSGMEQLSEVQPFAPSRIGSIENVRHKLGLQAFKAYCFGLPYYEKHPCDLFTTPKKDEKKPVPDLYLHLNQNGRAKFALEYERTVKSEARYADILRGYHAKGAYVIYLFDDQKTMRLIGLKLAKLMPTSWREGPQRLIFGLKDNLIQNSVHKNAWSYPSLGLMESYEYYGLSRLHGMLAQRVLVGDYEYYCLEYAKYKVYDPDIECDGVKHGSIEPLGQITPCVNYANRSKHTTKT